MVCSPQLGRQDGSPVAVMKLLEYFLLRPKQVISRTELLEKVWEMQFDPQSNIVDAHVARLRTKLRDIPGAPHIETSRGFGFILRED